MTFFDKLTGLQPPLVIQKEGIPMKYKAFSAITAAVMLCAAVTAQAPQRSIHAADSYDVEVMVDLNSYRKPISPYIYGVNSQFRTEEYLYPATAMSARQGGNRFTGYNWEENFSNAGRDYQHYSDAYLVDYDKEQLAIPGSPALGFAEEAAAKNVPYKITTIQMAGYVAADGNGAVTDTEAAPSARWKEVRARKGSAFSLTPDKTDDYVYMDEYVNYLVQNLGDASTKTGYQAYNLDNEPALWWRTHPYLHPAQPTCEEIVAKSTEYAAAIKDVDPRAEIFGLALYGISAYCNFGDAPDWAAHSDEYDWFVSYYLDEMRKAEEEHGRRLIDVIDLHYYSEAKGECRVTECRDTTHTACIEARLQAPRTLFDHNYVEKSWVGDNLQQYLPILYNVNKSIDKYYPGTKIGMTEYNFGGGNHISGAIAQADALGVYASQGVYVANIWQLNEIEYQLSAINLYTNYDGKGSAFGDTLVSAETSDAVKATAYASINGSDTSKLNMVLTNKSLTETQNSQIHINGDARYTSAKVYGITGDSSEIKLLETVDSIKDNQFTLSLPALSVVQIELHAENSLLMGDVNTDGSVDDADVRLLGDYLLAKKGTKISAANADMTQDGVINAFDLAMLKKQFLVWRTPPVTEDVVGFWETKAGQWKLKNGLGGKTVRCTFSAEAGKNLKLAFGYWDPTVKNEETGKMGIWVHNDTTQLGTHTFDETGRLILDIEIPESAMSVEIMIYNYMTTDESGKVIQLDKGEVSLEKVVFK